MTDNQIAIVIGLFVAIALWFFIYRKLQRKNQLLVLIFSYVLIIVLAWTGSDNSWKLSLLKTIVFGAMIVFSVDDLIKLRKKDNVVD